MLKKGEGGDGLEIRYDAIRNEMIPRDEMI